MTKILNKLTQNNQILPDLNQARKRLKSPIKIDGSLKLTDQQKKIGLNKTFHVRTYGCQSNFRDTEIIKGILVEMGFKFCEDLYRSDLVILNTCAIRENAELKVFGEIGFLKKSKLNNPNFMFGIAGCMSQEENVVKNITNKIQHIDFVIGTHNIHRLPQVITEVINTKNQIIEVWSHEGDIIENLPSVRDNKHKAFVNIMYGCDHFCTYCIVPYTRGKSRSRSKLDILEEIKVLQSNNYQEITLIGQNVNAYGIDLINEKCDLADLLEAVARTNIPRIRFVTSNPWNFNEKIIKIMMKYKNIMPYIHLPIQSGDEDILVAMNRTMSIKKYYELIANIRKSIPDCAISTDLIVGFPNETDKQFKNTLKLFNDLQFDNAYTFIYSPREGTPAALIKDSISHTIKQERLAQLNELVRKYAKINNEKFVGRTLQVMIDGKSKNNPNKLTGYTPEWKVVNFNGKGKCGEIVSVKIESASRFSLNGKMVE